MTYPADNFDHKLEVLRLERWQIEPFFWGDYLRALESIPWDSALCIGGKLDGQFLPSPDRYNWPEHWRVPVPSPARFEFSGNGFPDSETFHVDNYKLTRLIQPSDRQTKCVYALESLDNGDIAQKLAYMSRELHRKKEALNQFMASPDYVSRLSMGLSAVA